jgi:GTP:adenosylcobinamide-phosphate guanylyltransferase
MTKKLTQISKKKNLIAIIMAGGEGSRMKQHYKTEKPLLSINGKKMIEYIIESIINSDYFDEIIVCVSRRNPRTRIFLQQYNYKHATHIQIINGNGNGYSADLSCILKNFVDSILLIIPADLPLFSQSDISEILNKCDFNKPCNTIIIYKKIINELGIKPSFEFQYRRSTYCYSGITIFNLNKKYHPGKIIEERYVTINNVGIAVNVNEKQDLDIARTLMKRLKNNNYNMLNNRINPNDRLNLQ